MSTDIPSIQPNTDLQCQPYNVIISNRIQHIGISAEFLRDDPKTGWVRPAAFASRQGVNRGDQLSAGARFSTLYPSQCFACIITNVPREPSAVCPNPTGLNPWCGNEGPSYTCIKLNPKIGMNQILLAKKNYILQNNKGNVISGLAAGKNTWARNQALGGFGGGQTKAQIWSNVARGRAPSGMPAKQYGVQNVTITTPNLFPNSTSRLADTITACKLK
jgi:hypothetical protein